MTRQFICGKCNEPVPEGAAACPNCDPPPPGSSMRRPEAVPLFLIIILLCSSFLMVGSSYVNVAQFSSPAPSPKPAATFDRNLAAYTAAKNFVLQKYPGAKTISPFYQSAIEQAGDSFTVMVTADAIVHGQAVRNFYRVEVTASGQDWQLKSITQ